ncbi:MAG: hypothetical protein V4454_14270 [Pseudomonadota bacterium]
MSEVTNFLDLSRGSNPRGIAYTVQSPDKAGTRPHPSRTRSDAFPRNTKEPEKPSFAASVPYDEQIRTALTNHHRFIGSTPSRASVKNRVVLLTSFYKELQAGGFDIQDVTKFSLRHAKALLEIWNTKGCAANTLYVRWSVLRGWSRVLSKHGMIGPLTDYEPGFERKAETLQGYRVLSGDEVATRSNFLRAKPDLTHYLVDRITREIKVTREIAFQFQFDAVRGVVEGGNLYLRVGLGNQQKNIPHIQDHSELMLEVRDFMQARNRKTLAWTGLDLDAAIQKYALRMAYVNRTIFPKATVASPHQKEGGDA